jgi:hypothetical protein
VNDLVREILRLLDEDGFRVGNRFDTLVVPEEVWVRVVTDHPDYAWGVVHKDGLPDEALRILARHEDNRIRWLVAYKTGLPADVILELSRDVDEGVRSRISFNPGTPLEVLERLAEDEQEVVSRPARNRLEGKEPTA